MCVDYIILQLYTVYIKNLNVYATEYVNYSKIMQVSGVLLKFNVCVIIQYCLNLKCERKIVLHKSFTYLKEQMLCFDLVWGLHFDTFVSLFNRMFSGESCYN